MRIGLWTRGRASWPLTAAPLVFLFVSAASAAERCIVLGSNMKVLNCAMPDKDFRFLGSNAPGQLFLPGERVSIQIALKQSEGDFALEIQEVTTRDPEKKIEGMEGFTDTGGHAPLLGLEGKPILFPLQVTFYGQPEVQVGIHDFPLPQRFGTYALILVHNGKRQFLGTVARIPKPREDGNLENTPIFGEAAIFDNPELYAKRAATYDRMGVRGIRLEIGWNENKDGTVDWKRLDAYFTALEGGHIQAMVTLGGHPQWAWPFSPQQTPAVVGPKWDGNPYWGQSDWLCDPKLEPRYGTWITAFCERYWKGGKGALWGIDHYNEPWEGGGISGWASDGVRYRDLMKLIAESAWKVDRRIKMCAASSIMNTEDRFYSTGGTEWDKYLDVLTDHYVVPSMCYGPMVAKAHGKESVETETWFVNSEYLLPQGVAQFLACGQRRLSPWHPRVLFDSVPGVDDQYFIPTPVCAATAAFNAFATGKPFEKIVFHNHLPWVFQFGKDDDPEALLIVFGQLMTIGGDDPRDRLWAQVDSAPGGTMTINNRDRLLQFFDLAGNPMYVRDRQVKLPMSIFPTYIRCAQGPKAAAERLQDAVIGDKRPVEILPYDFDTRVGPGARLRVGVHNCINRGILGYLQVLPPPGLSLKTTKQQLKLEAGETRVATFELSDASPNPANAYPFVFSFTSDAGNADWKEVLNAAIVPKRTITVDGNLDDWKDIPSVTLVGTPQKAEITELLRRPWLELKDEQPEGNFAEFKLAWDESFLYVAARVNDPTPQSDLPRLEGRNEDEWFHSAASDTREPYATFLKKFPGRSFAEVPHVYSKSPEWNIPFRRDRLQIALDVADGWHDLTPTTDKVPYGFHAVPDTDYEYSLYLCSDGKSELWRQLAPGVPRIHDWPRQPRGPKTTGPVPGAKHVVKLDGKVYTYEMAIPRQELATLKLAPGTTFGLMLRAGNQKGPHCDYGVAKAITKSNGLTLHPYWERSSNCAARWTLVE